MTLVDGKAGAIARVPLHTMPGQVPPSHPTRPHRSPGAVERAGAALYGLVLLLAGLLSATVAVASGGRWVVVGTTVTGAPFTGLMGMVEVISTGTLGAMAAVLLLAAKSSFAFAGGSERQPGLSLLAVRILGAFILAMFGFITLLCASEGHVGAAVVLGLLTGGAAWLLYRRSPNRRQQ